MSKRRKRRTWSDDEKREICHQTAAPGVSVAQVARRYALNANMMASSTCLKQSVSVHDQTAALFRPKRHLLSARSYRHSRKDAFDLWTEYANEMTA